MENIRRRAKGKIEATTKQQTIHGNTRRRVKEKSAVKYKGEKGRKGERIERKDLLDKEYILGKMDSVKE